MLLGVEHIGLPNIKSISVLASAVLSLVIQISLGQSCWSIGITVAGLIIVAASVVGCALLKQILAYFNVLEYAKIEKSIQEMPRRESVFDILAETSPLVISGEAAGDLVSGTPTEQSVLRLMSKRMMMGFLWSSLGGMCYCVESL